MKTATISCKLVQRKDQLLYECTGKTDMGTFFATTEEMVGLLGFLPAAVALFFSDTRVYSEATGALPEHYEVHGMYVTRHLIIPGVNQTFPVITGTLSEVIKSVQTSSNGRHFYLCHKIIKLKEKAQ